MKSSLELFTRRASHVPETRAPVLPVDVKSEYKIYAPAVAEHVCEIFASRLMASNLVLRVFTEKTS